MNGVSKESYTVYP